MLASDDGLAGGRSAEVYTAGTQARLSADGTRITHPATTVQLGNPPSHPQSQAYAEQSVAKLGLQGFPALFRDECLELKWVSMQTAGRLHGGC